MFYKIILLSCVVILCDAALEGDQCTKNGKIGTCRNVQNCYSAIEDIKHKIHPQLCGFNKTDAIVCCLDKILASVRPTPLTVRPTRSTTEYVPTYYVDDLNNYDTEAECPPIHAVLTANKTGQKAFDKCIEYQEKYVYPCERGLVGWTRSNHCTDNADELIVVDSVAKNQFSHIVMLGFEGDTGPIEWLCAGSVISDQFVLTAARCTFDGLLGRVKYIFTGGRTQSEKENAANTYKVKRFILHPDFVYPKKYNDIALLEADRAFKLSKYLVPACLHLGNPVKDDSVISLTWSKPHWQDSSDVRRKLLLRKPSAEECSAKYPLHQLMRRGINDTTQMCYGDLKSKEACLGEFGGPIQIKSRDVNCMYLVTGVMSLGDCRRHEDTGIFTRVSAYVPWIESVVWP